MIAAVVAALLAVVAATIVQFISIRLRRAKVAARIKKEKDSGYDNLKVERSEEWKKKS